MRTVHLLVVGLRLLGCPLPLPRHHLMKWNLALLIMMSCDDSETSRIVAKSPLSPWISHGRFNQLWFSSLVNCSTRSVIVRLPGSPWVRGCWTVAMNMIVTWVLGEASGRQGRHHGQQPWGRPCSHHGRTGTMCWRVWQEPWNPPMSGSFILPSTPPSHKSLNRNRSSW